MIITFEEQTADLNKQELSLVPLIAETLRYKYGVRAAITNKELQHFIAACTDEHGKPYRLKDSRIRKIINYIRIKNLVPKLIATSRGYFVATNKKEMEDYIQSLRSREGAIREVRHSMERILETEYI